MNRTQLACRVMIAITACAMLQSVAMGQATCQCQKHPIIAQPRMTVTSRLPDSWPRQWGDPVVTVSPRTVAKSALTNNATVSKQHSQSSSAINVNARTRDPFTGEWVAAGSQTRWSKSGQTRNSSTTSQRIASADGSSESTPKSDKSSSESKTSDTSTSGFSSGAAYGGGSSFGGSGGGASGGSFGGGMSGGNSGGFNGGSASTPRTSGFSGGVSGGFGGGSGSSGKSSGTPTPDPTPKPDPHAGNGGGLAVIPPPHCPVPPVLPEIPPTGGDPVPPTDHNPGNGAGEAPIVPEPGSIVLLSIAMGVGGAGYIRHRRRRADSPIPASP
ncbi:MAG: PEP-CTERM sorting domain-containing protein [Fuerstia sp.]|nr:PEP-CTERM sorting domain-containing protein [Fuerstiella sp.]